jgi:hypothetical protein
VVVDLGETDVLVGQMAQLGQGVVNGNGARGNRFQQRLQLLVDLRASGLERSKQIISDYFTKDGSASPLQRGPGCPRFINLGCPRFINLACPRFNIE